jgi:hypothetical protein
VVHSIYRRLLKLFKHLLRGYLDYVNYIRAYLEGFPYKILKLHKDLPKSLPRSYLIYVRTYLKSLIQDYLGYYGLFKGYLG